MTTERPLPERKVSNNVEAFIEQYDKINKDDDNGSPEKGSKSSKNGKDSVGKKKKKSKKKKEPSATKNEGIEEIKLVKVILIFIQVLYIFSMILAQ